MSLIKVAYIFLEFVGIVGGVFSLAGVFMFVGSFVEARKRRIAKRDDGTEESAL